MFHISSLSGEGIFWLKLTPGAECFCQKNWRIGHDVSKTLLNSNFKPIFETSFEKSRFGQRKKGIKCFLVSLISASPDLFECRSRKKGRKLIYNEP